MLKTVMHAISPVADAISLLKQDHRKVEALFKEFEDADDKRSKGTIARKICMELDVHAKIEEKILYPAAKRDVKDAKAEVNEAFVEHAAIKRLVREINALTPADEMFEAKVTVLIEFVKHHVREEENEMFPKLTESDLDLRQLGERMSAAKERLQAQPAPEMRRATTARRGRSQTSRGASASA